MTLDDFIVNVDALIKAFETEMPAISDEIALNALALVKHRIVDEGHGIEGAHYSEKPMLATKSQFVVKSAFKQTVIKEKGHKPHPLWIKFPKAKKAVPVMELEHGYKEFREIQGRPGEYVNGSYTGKMWQGTTITARSHNGFTWATIIGGNNKEAQDKLGWMTQKFGQFLAVEPDEVTLLNKVYGARLQSIIERFIQ